MKNTRKFKINPNKWKLNCNIYKITALRVVLAIILIINKNIFKNLFIFIKYRLKHLEKYQILHRDVKLENIILKDKDSNDLKLVDFGLATYIKNAI